MSTSQNFSVYKTLPYNVYARAAGKWDYLQTNQVYNSSQTVNIAMSNYDGLSMTAETQGAAALPLDFSNTVLPWKWDYYDYLETNKYCFMPVGQWYGGFNSQSLNIDVVGSPTISDTFIASGFSGVNFLRDSAFDTSKTWELGMKVKTSSTNVDQNYFSLSSTGFSISGGQWTFWIMKQAGGYIAQNQRFGSVSADTWYWIKFIYDGTKYEFYVSTDGSTYTLTATFNNSSRTKQGTYFWLGCYEGGSTSPGTYCDIDLKECYIKLDGSSWWTGTIGETGSLQGCTYNYTDDGSAVTLNAFVVDNDKSVVLTPDNSYTNGYLLGTVNIPIHDVYTYSETTTAWIQPTLSANGTIGGDSFAVGTESSTYKAFDDDNTTYYRSTNNYGDKIIEFYNPTPIVVTRLDITNYSIWLMGDWEFQYSDDGDKWVALITGINTGGASQQWGFNVTNSGAHSYYRIKSTSNTYTAVVEVAITAHTVTPTWTLVE